MTKIKKSIYLLCSQVNNTFQRTTIILKLYIYIMKTETIGARTYIINTEALTIEIRNTKGRTVKCWRFSNEVRINEYMETMRSRLKAHEEYKEKRKVWSMFYSSRGYEQTNVDFYQVIEKKGMTLKLRRIGAERVETHSSMSEDVKPVKDSFRDEEILTKRINNYWDISLNSYASASLIEDENRTFFTSSRA